MSNRFTAGAQIARVVVADWIALVVLLVGLAAELAMARRIC